MSRVVVCPFVPKHYAINIFGSIWVKSRSILTKRIINHERIHTAQQRELLWLPFYIFYFIEWLIRLLQYRNADKAYRNISFEKEAYANDYNLSYLNKRKLWAQWRSKK